MGVIDPKRFSAVHADPSPKYTKGADSTCPDAGADTIRYGRLRQKLAGQVKQAELLVTFHRGQVPIDRRCRVMHILGAEAQRRSARQGKGTMRVEERHDEACGMRILLR